MGKKIRVWKLGSLAHSIYPTKEAIEKLAKLLSNPDITDLVWGPDLEVVVVDAADEDVVVESTE